MQKYLKVFLDTLSDWVWEMDINGVHTYSNGAIAKILGYTPEEIVGMHVTEIWPEEMVTEASVAKFNREIKDGIPWQGFRGKFRHKDGSTITLESSGMPLYDEKNRLIGFRGVDRDIHETLRKEQQLEASRKRFQELSERFAWENNFKTLLLDIIAHDILNQVNVLSGLSELLLKESPEDERFQLINYSSHRLITVINSAATLAKITSGQEISKSELDLTTVLSEVIQDYQQPMKMAGIELVQHSTGPCTVRANPIISEIFKNYLDNALKYALEGNIIEVRAGKANNEVIIEIADQGKTIRKNDRVRIFKRGVQLDASKKGSGIGLAIVEQIAKAHQGKVGVRPNSPRGNVFYFKMDVH
ncbi:MAG: PAS domain-containing sensor histidine kinase [Candidatus Marinimicrobia bacterium]|nr:PAS domain-containing sensor histidine kinase [Candidatus Neomarinimicrobiota bacterium]MCF7840185.1 PAS domain-containing sensor histidine kinase [Candidatus Neomarinimicrobiota bacterium]